MPETSATDSTQAVAILDSNVALSSEAGWNEQKLQWDSVLGAGILPDHVANASVAITIARYGDEVFGWGAIESCMKLVVIKGKVTLWAETLMGLMAKHCHETSDLIWPVERSLERAAIAVKRAGWPAPYTFEFTQQNAVTAGLWGSGTWAKYPEAMLWARCVSIVSRGAYTDVTGGAFAREEFTPAHVTVRQLDDDEPLEDMIAPPAEVPAD